jgi:predicted Zn-dependent protease
MLFCSCNKIVEYIPIEVDKTLGEQFSNQMNLNPMGGEILDPTKNKEAYAYIQKIRDNILNSDDIKYKKDFKWELRIIKDDSTLNAFCIAGGYIYVYTGLIKFLDSEAELAGVMAHEIAHAECRHTTMRMVSEYGISLIISIMAGGDMTFLVNIGKEILGLSFSRSDEAQADEMAVTYLYDTNYDPRAVGGFFKKMIVKQKDAKIPEFLSTHPSSENRVNDIENTWKKLGSKEGKYFTKEYNEAKKRMNLAF